MQNHTETKKVDRKLYKN